MDRYKIDLHTHTIVSGHAYNTLQEMARRAADEGITILGITEHAPEMPGTCHNFYFHNLKVVPREMFGVKLLLGTEVNIMNYEGGLDLRPSELEMLDVVIASLHIPCIKPGTVEENTRALVKTMENPLVDIIGHPDDARYPVNYEVIVDVARETGTLLEINNNSLNPTSTREGAQENDRRILELCKEREVPVILGSDAHIDIKIGGFEYIYPLLEELDFPEELIVNGSEEKLMSYLN